MTDDIESLIRTASPAPWKVTDVPGTPKVNIDDATGDYVAEYVSRADAEVIVALRNRVGLAEAALTLAKARERYYYIMSLTPDTMEAAVDHGRDQMRAYDSVLKAEKDLDAEYRREEYGEVAE